MGINSTTRITSTVPFLSNRSRPPISHLYVVGKPITCRVLCRLIVTDATDGVEFFDVDTAVGVAECHLGRTCWPRTLPVIECRLELGESVLKHQNLPLQILLQSF